MKRVVITGLGTICSIGNNTYEMWNSVLNNRSGIDYIKSIDYDQSKVKIAAEVKNIDLEKFLTPKDIHYNSKFINFAKIAAKEAFVDSNLDEEAIDHDRFGVIISSSIGGCEKIEDSYEKE